MWMREVDKACPMSKFQSKQVEIVTANVFDLKFDANRQINVVNVIVLSVARHSWKPSCADSTSSAFIKHHKTCDEPRSSESSSKYMHSDLVGKPFGKVSTWVIVELSGPFWRGVLHSHKYDPIISNLWRQFRIPYETIWNLSLTQVVSRCPRVEPKWNPSCSQRNRNNSRYMTLSKGPWLIQLHCKHDIL